MKAVVLLIISLSLFGAKAVVKIDTIDLYKQPYQQAQKRADFFHKGDILRVHSCDRFGWCRVKQGYVKGHLLLFTSGKTTKIATPKSAVKFESVQKSKKVQVAETEYIDIGIYDVNKTLKKRRTLDTNVSVKETTNSLAYEHYFEPTSATLQHKR